jgi:hypothetical protein
VSAQKTGYCTVSLGFTGTHIMLPSASKTGNLYRIVSFDRAAEIITGRKLYFASPSSWDDPFERALKNSAAQAIFAQCWCRKAVSDAMWRIYSPHSLGVRIATTRQRLKHAIVAARDHRSLSFAILDVEYLKQEVLTKRLDQIRQNFKREFSPPLAMEPLFMKRLAFDHERETRAVILDEACLTEEPKKGISIPVDPFKLLTSIWVDPRAPDEVLKAYRYYLKDKLGFPGKVERSGLYAVPDDLTAESEA